MPRNSLVWIWWFSGFIRKASGTSKASTTSFSLMVNLKPGFTLATVGRMRKPNAVP